MAFSKEEVEALQARVKEKGRRQVVSPFTGQHSVIIPKAKAIAVERDRGMNKTERKYSLYLEALKRTGEIAWWGFECIKLRLADSCTYNPDFMVVTREGFIEICDTKAYWKKIGKAGITDDALVKMKGIAEKYPMFKVLATWEKDGKWEQRVF